MLKDLGHRDAEFGNAVSFIRKKLLEIAQVSEEEYTTVPMQGSGTFAVESVLGTTIPKETGKVFVITNGTYGKRIARMVDMMGFENVRTIWKMSSKLSILLYALRSSNLQLILDLGQSNIYVTTSSRFYFRK